MFLEGMMDSIIIIIITGICIFICKCTHNHTLVLLLYTLKNSSTQWVDCALKYHFNAPEREAYQKSTYCQNVTNHSFITRHFMKQETHCRVLVTNQWGRTFVCKQHIVRFLSRTTPFHRVIAGSLHKSFWNILAVNTH